MPMDPAKRIANWDQKYDTAAIKALLDKKRPDMFARVSAQITALASMESQVKQVLDMQGVSVITYPFYLCFGRELWHIVNMTEMSGESAAKEASVLAQKWVGRSLTLSVLELIRTQVFNIGPVSGPGP
jgi:hypothetical protein